MNEPGRRRRLLHPRDARSWQGQENPQKGWAAPHAAILPLGAAGLGHKSKLRGFGDSDKHKKQHLSLSSICSGVCGDEHTSDPWRKSPVRVPTTTTQGSSAAPASPGSHLRGTCRSWDVPLECPCCQPWSLLLCHPHSWI